MDQQEDPLPLPQSEPQAQNTYNQAEDGKKAKKKIVIALLGLLIISVFLAIIFFYQAGNQKQAQNIQPSSLSPTPVQTIIDEGVPTISPEEIVQIETWIERNDLNEFGDPRGTMYAGGNPLFNEATGKSTERFEYIIRNHPDKPWRTQKAPTGESPASGSANPSINGDAPVCTLDAKICPDGSSVGRQGLNCEFAPCPGE